MLARRSPAGRAPTGGDRTTASGGETDLGNVASEQRLAGVHVVVSDGLHMTLCSHSYSDSNRMTPDDDKKLIEILKRRDTLHTKVELRDGKVINVWNIVHGYDPGDDFAHITTNIRPYQTDLKFDFFFTTEVAKVIDGDTGHIIVEFG